MAASLAVAVMASLALSELLAGSVAFAETARARDPVRVLFAPGNCASEVFEVQLWSRSEGTWLPHEGHRLLADGACVWEDAGQLLNEIRSRCVPRTRDEVPVDWRVGVPVFAAGVIDRCRPPQPGDPVVEILRPRSGDRLEGSLTTTQVEGVVSRAEQVGPAPDLIEVIVENRSLRAFASAVRIRADGRFSAQLELGPGPNHIRVVARDASGREGEAGIAVLFISDAAREKAMAAERDRIEKTSQASRKRVTIEAVVDAGADAND